MDSAPMVVLWAFVISFLLTLVLMPLALTLGHHFKMVARPRYFRKSRSHRPIYYLGGTVVAVSTTSASFIAAGSRAPLAAALGAGLILGAVGFRENTRSLKSIPLLLRICIQAGLAALVWLVELQGQLPGPVGAATAIVLMVGAANAFNLLDNMNGVAGLTSAVTAAGITGLAFLIGIPQAAPAAAALCGASLGFLRHNLVRARLYLGGGGPEFIGFVLCASALKVCLAFGPKWGLVSTLAVLAVPFVDSTVTIGARIASGRSPLKGGVDHLSHRLVRLGLSTRRVARLHGLAAAGAIVAVALAIRYGPKVILVALALLLVLAIGIALAGEREEPKPPKQRRRRSAAPLAFGVAILILWTAAPALAAARDLYATRNAFLQGMTALKAFDLESARESFLKGGQSAAQADKKLASPLTLPARFVPVVSDNLNAARALATGARLLAPAVVEALGAADEFPREPSGRPQFGLDEGRLDLHPWPRAQERVRKAAAGSRVALTGVRAANGILAPPLADARDKFLAEGNRAVEILEKAEDTAGFIPYLFGADRPLTWFLAIQNPVELRATGGFLGAFGILRSEGGVLKLERFEANSALPKVSRPPSASPEYVAHYDQFSSRTTWVNANMTPDFPTAAEVIAGMWETATGKHIDGVMAMDAVGLNHLLKVVGPVTVDPIGKISSENFLPLVLNEAYIRFPEKETRADFLLEVGREAWRRLLGGRFSDPRVLSRFAAETVTGKHLQIWSPGQENLVKRLGLSGELESSEDSDYLMVVGQNAAANKVDYYARRRLSYKVDISNPDDVRAQLTFQIRNDAPAAGLPRYIIGPYFPFDPPGLNRTYTSIFLGPTTGVLDARVDGSPVEFESHSEKGFGVVSRYLEIMPGKTSVFDLTLRRRLFRPGIYRLKVQRQANLNPDRLEIDIVLPQGASVHDATDGMEVEGNHVRWKGPLERDLEFSVRYGSLAEGVLGGGAAFKSLGSR